MEVARSDDGGATWGPFVQISPLGDGAFAGGIVATASGDLVVPTRSGPADRSTVALTLFRSSDRGETSGLLEQIGATTVRMADIIEGLLSLSQLMGEPVVRQEVDVTRLAWDLTGELQSRSDRSARFVRRHCGQCRPDLAGHPP